MNSIIRIALVALLALGAGAPAWANDAAVAMPAVVDINTADARTLAKALEGVGKRKARAIVAYREKNGRFISVDDLALVEGVGKRTVNLNRERLRVDSQE